MPIGIKVNCGEITRNRARTYFAMKRIIYAVSAVMSVHHARPQQECVSNL